MQSLAYSLRRFAKRPGFWSVVFLTLSLGIGTTTAVFSIVNAVLLRPLPYSDPGKLMLLWSTRLNTSQNDIAVSHSDFYSWRTQNKSFVDLAAYSPTTTILGGEFPLRVSTAQASVNLFFVLGVRAILGRRFLPEDGRPGKNPVVLISHRFWQQQFGSDLRVTGREIHLDGQKYLVIGVLPPRVRLTYPRETDLFIPVIFNPNERASRGLRVIGRLRQGMTIHQATAEMNTIAARLALEYPDTNSELNVNVVPLHEYLFGHTRQSFLVLLSVGAFFLMICCTNVASLLLTQAVEREKEMAMRTAVGASRTHILRQLVVEGTIVAAVGGVLGLLFSSWVLHLVGYLLPPDLPRADEINIDNRVLVFTFALSVLVSLLFSLIPAVKGSAPRFESLKEAARTSTAGLRTRRTHALLVVSQIALAVVLSIGAGLMVRTFLALNAVTLGFDPHNLLTVWLNPRSKYPDTEQRIQFFEDLIARLRANPNISAVGAVSALPFSGFNFVCSIDPGKSPSLEVSEINVALRAISADYFRVMRIPILKGRPFSREDGPGALPVAIINETMARRLWRSKNPIRSQLTIRTNDGPKTLDIVGVVGNVKHESLGAATAPEIYIPYRQFSPSTFMFLLLRTESEPRLAIAFLRRSTFLAGYNDPVDYIQTMEQRLTDSIAKELFYTKMLGSLAGLSIILASIGLYSILSYLVTQRAHEIGIRMALGASKNAILRLIITYGLIVVGSGVGLGVLGALIVTRFLSTFLYGVTAVDSFTFVVTALILTSVALAASYPPARRAANVDPVTSLRYE